MLHDKARRERLRLRIAWRRKWGIAWRWGLRIRHTIALFRLPLEAGLLFSCFRHLIAKTYARPAKSSGLEPYSIVGHCSMCRAVDKMCRRLC